MVNRRLKSAGAGLSARDQGDGNDASQKQAQHRDGEEHPEPRRVRHHQAAERHGDSPHHKAPSGHLCRGVCGRQLTRGEIETEIQHAQAEEGDVAEPVEASPEAAVAAEPILAMEKHPQQQSRAKPESDPHPGQHQVKLRRAPKYVGIRRHTLFYSADGRERLIDKTSARIDKNDTATESLF